MNAAGPPSRGGEYARATAVVAVATAICLALRAHLAAIDVAMLLLVGVVLVAGQYQRGPALFASVLSIAAFDFFFVPPYYTFNVRDSAYYLTFVVMLVVALAMSRLTARIREQREAVDRRERRTAALYALDRELAEAADGDALLATAGVHLSRVAEGQVRFLLAADLGDRDEEPRLPAEPPFIDPVVRLAVTRALTHRAPAGWGFASYPEVDLGIVPLIATSGLLGLATIQPNDADRSLAEDRRETLLALVDLTASLLDRRQLAERGERARVEVQAEKLRSALLSSLSHDLKSPLSTIEGAASSLLEQPSLPAPVRTELLEGVLDESRRMTRLVTNLLNIVRVETGTLSVEKSWQPLEEALGVALLRLQDRLGDHPVTTRLPHDLPMVPIDELLIEQVFLNLLENVVRYTAPGTAIEIEAVAEPGNVLVEVADRGPGVAAGQEELVFDRFYRGHGEPAGDGGAGSGLGLTICRGIIMAHGGRIWMESRNGGGAQVRFTLPLTGPPIDPIPPELPAQ